MIKFLVCWLLIVSSCQSYDIEITKLACDSEVIVFPSWKKDSLELFVPVKYKIHNAGSLPIHLSDITFKPRGKHIDTDFLVVDGDSIQKVFSSKARDIGGGEFKTYTIYLKKYRAKNEVDKVYWKDFPAVRENFKKILNYKHNRINPTAPISGFLKNEIEADSLAFTFDSHDGPILKIFRIGENKYKTFRKSDALNNNLNSQSIFKP